VRRYVFRRSIESLVALWLATIIVFVGVRSLPGDPAIALSGEGMDPQANAAIRERYGLDEPMPVQYVRWLAIAATGDLGTSIRTRQRVTDEILSRIPVTLELAAITTVIALLIGVPLGVLAAVRRRTKMDYVAGSIGLLGLSVPTFWLGMILILIFAITLRWLPASGFVPFLEDPIENLKRMLLPSFVLAASLGAVLLRQIRSGMIGALGSDYVRTARAKGLHERQVVLGHALRNSLIIVVTILGLELGALISGAVITESVFLIPGFGRLIIEAIMRRDYPMIQGAALVSAIAYIAINFGVDILYSALNPKVRMTGDTT
jgi:peptide/nickel transport system permease protein